MRWKGDPKRMDLKSKWSSGVGMRVPRNIPLRSFVEYSLFHFLPREPLLFHYDRALTRWNFTLNKRNKQWHHLLSRDSRRLLKKVTLLDLRENAILDFYM